MPQQFLTYTSATIKIKMCDIMTDIHETHGADYSKILTDSLNYSKWHMGTDPD